MESTQHRHLGCFLFVSGLHTKIELDAIMSLAYRYRITVEYQREREHPAHEIEHSEHRLKDCQAEGGYPTQCSLVWPAGAAKNRGYLLLVVKGGVVAADTLRRLRRTERARIFFCASNRGHISGGLGGKSPRGFGGTRRKLFPSLSSLHRSEVETYFVEHPFSFLAHFASFETCTLIVDPSTQFRVFRVLL
jgi:hypothetical protein